MKMSELTQGTAPESIKLAADIIAAYVLNNPAPAAELPTLIGNVHSVLNGLAQGVTQADAAEEFEKATPAQIRKSITPDALISFIDGKPYKTLKRHLTGHGLDPHSYRQR
jgi:predicted transcriptional regulator